MISFQNSYVKAQTISGDFSDTTLIQLKQDINIGYKRFNNAIARYFTRKQQYTDIVADQQYYQIPIDAIRVSNITVTLPNGYIYPVVEVKDEFQWRQMNIVPFHAQYATSYFVLGNDQLGLYPIPSSDVSAGLRYIYQPTDVDLTKDDYSTGTVSITNGGVTVTGVGTTWNATHKGLFFEVTNGTDGNQYEIIAIPNSTTLTLKTPYVGPSVSGGTYILQQLFIFPGEYNDVPVDYALSRFFEYKNNATRAQYHYAKFQQQVKDAVEKYASTSTSNVITGNEDYLNMWYMPPVPGVS
jgi:hypothetical protein